MNPACRAPHLDTRHIPSRDSSSPPPQLIFRHFLTMVAQPQLHDDIYPAVDPAKFVGSQKGVVCVVIGSSQ
jgi:F0F1-type ATP synthase beta subunit